MFSGRRRKQVYTGFILFAILIGVLMIARLVFAPADEGPRAVDITEYP